MFGGRAAGIEVTNSGGGVIDGNEVFDNHFDGICLATGVSPTMSGVCVCCTCICACVCACTRMCVYVYVVHDRVVHSPNIYCNSMSK